MLHQTYLEESSSHINHVLKKRFQVIYNQPNAAAPNHLKPCPSLSITPKAHQKEASNPQMQQCNRGKEIEVNSPKSQSSNHRDIFE
jgi:hypothetical protein